MDALVLIISIFKLPSKNTVFIKKIQNGGEIQDDGWSLASTNIFSPNNAIIDEIMENVELFWYFLFHAIIIRQSIGGNKFKII
jgi:hypothetical protein